MIDFKHILPNIISDKDDWWEILNEYWLGTADSLGIKDIIFLGIPEDSLYTRKPKKWDSNGVQIERIKKYIPLNIPTLPIFNITIPSIYDGYQMGTGRDGKQRWMATGHPNFGDWLEVLREEQSNNLVLIIQAISLQDNVKNLKSHITTYKETNLVPKNGTVTLKYKPQIGIDPKNQVIRVNIKNGIMRTQEIHRMLESEMILPDDIIAAYKEGDTIEVNYQAEIPQPGLRSNSNAIKILKLINDFSDLANVNPPKIKLKEDVKVNRSEKQKSAVQQIKEAKERIEEERLKVKIMQNKEAAKLDGDEFRHNAKDPKVIKKKRIALEQYRLERLQAEESLHQLYNGLLFYNATLNKWVSSHPNWSPAINTFILDTYYEWKMTYYEQRKNITMGEFLKKVRENGSKSASDAIANNRIMYNYALDRIHYWPILIEDYLNDIGTRKSIIF